MEIRREAEGIESKGGLAQKAQKEAEAMNSQRVALRKALLEAQKARSLGHFGLAYFWGASALHAIKSLEN